MPKLSRALWAIKIKAARRVHLAESDDNFGGPLAVTLCGKKYDSADRVSATKNRQFSGAGPMCEGCLRKVGYVDPEKRRNQDILRIIQMLADWKLPAEDVEKVFADLVKQRDQNALLRESEAVD
jgi:hypothetical protein